MTHCAPLDRSHLPFVVVLAVLLILAGKQKKDLRRRVVAMQRQLSGEGTSYRDILESTRQALAEKYLRDGDFSQAEIAFMVGFSDQSNFARAFKRWTGMSPGEFQKAA